MPLSHLVTWSPSHLDTKSLGKKQLVAWPAEQLAKDKSGDRDHFRAPFDTDSEVGPDPAVTARGYSVSRDAGHWPSATK